ncbi:MAG: chromate transporter [Gemmatimonadetes bacterium]|nr:chromate transporter [Gemmatimonadota bacterium]
MVLAVAGVAPARAGGDATGDGPVGLPGAPRSGFPRRWSPGRSTIAPSIRTLFGSGRAGLLTFGGAYTAIPFLRSDAVITGRWMTDAQFLDGLALSSVLPAPFIIFSTFVGIPRGRDGWGGRRHGWGLPPRLRVHIGGARPARTDRRDAVHHAFRTGSPRGGG